MKENDNDFVTMFDNFYTTNHIQILKALIPFVQSDSYFNLPVLIKYMELQHTITVTSTQQKPAYPTSILQNSVSQTEPTILGFSLRHLEDIYSAISHYLEPGEAKHIEEIFNLSKTISQFQEMQQMMSIFKDLSPEIDGENPNMNDIMSLLQNLSNS